MSPGDKPATSDELIAAMRGRAAEDVAPATEADLVAAESALGFDLFPLHRRLLAEIQNGGFGPGFGIIGTDTGFLDDDSGSVVTGTRRLDLPRPLVVLCNWGCGTWSCVDSRDGRVVTCDGTWGLTDLGQGLASWLADWLAHVDLRARMYERGTRMGLNPFTREPIEMSYSVRALGIPYVPGGEE